MLGRRKGEATAHKEENTVSSGERNRAAACSGVAGRERRNRVRRAGHRRRPHRGAVNRSHPLRRALHPLSSTALGSVGLAAFGWLAAAAPAPIDLDVAVPPGSALEWTRAFPLLSPRPGPLFPKAPENDTTPPPGRTRALPRTVDVDARASESFALMRILTWDLGAHLEWVRGRWPELARPRTGPLARALPEPSEPFYWICLAPFLHAALHPALISEPEVIAHLVELGEPVLPLIDVVWAEPSLHGLCREVRRRIVPAQGGPRSPLRDPDDFERDLFLRFVFGELVAAHPYDPDAGFGARLFLFGDALAPHVAAYTSHPEPFVRRNATAALARYDTPEAAETLLVLARTTDDPVVLVRALTGLARQRSEIDPSPLIARFEKSRDPVERAALAGLFGSRGEPAATSALFDAARKARKRDPELLSTYLWALARIPPDEPDGELDRFLAELARQALKRPPVFTERGHGPSSVADRLDPPETRGLLLHQLALLARARRAPLDELVGREVRALAQPGRAPWPTSSTRAPSAISGVLPAAQRVWIDALERDPEGHELLRNIAADPAVELGLRMHALSRLPGAERDRLAAELLESNTATTEAKVFALDLLDADRSSLLEASARGVLARFAQASPGRSSPAERALFLSAIRALDRRGTLSAEDLVPLVLRHIAPTRDGATPADHLRAQVRGFVESAVDRARRPGTGKAEQELEMATAQLVDFAIRMRINPELQDPMREIVVAALRSMLAPLHSQRKDDELAVRITDQIVSWLYTWNAPRIGSGATAIRPPVPLEEAVLLALGRTRDPQAVSLLERLVESESFPHRAAACLALGATGDPSAVCTLAYAMLAEDPFTRLVAWLAARRLSGEEFRADWLDGSLAERSAAAERYLAWGRAHR